MSDRIILIDKPAGMTSFGVVARIRRVLSQQAREEKTATGATGSSAAPDRPKRVKVGHTGTLDPFATGLMILVTGKECKNASQYSKLDKVYQAVIRLGQTSSTGDPEGELTEVSQRQPDLDEITQALSQFRGDIQQRPPIFSAIKINGQRAYKLARDGKEVDIPERQVTVHELELVDYSYPDVTVRAHVSSGTYIRSLAVDIGQVLQTGAYCRSLRRTEINRWSLDEAKQLSDFGIID